MVFIIYNLQKHSRMKSNEYFKIIIRIQCANDRKSNDNNSIKFYILKHIYTKGNFRKDPHKHIWLYSLRIHVVITSYLKIQNSGMYRLSRSEKCSGIRKGCLTVDPDCSIAWCSGTAVRESRFSCCSAVNTKGDVRSPKRLISEAGTFGSPCSNHNMHMISCIYW